MTEPLVSIIVPIYNVEQYLQRCVDSLINQTYRNLEIILVDDGSPDRCGEICDDYAKGDSRIKVIHKSNGGLSDARNKGLDMASGDYVMFVDSDDWIDSQTCENSIRNAIGNNADIVVFGMYLFYDNGRLVKRNKGIISSTPSHEECMRSLIYKIPEAGIFNNVCNKMFHRRLFTGITFPVGLYAEDQGTIYKLIHKADKVYVCDKHFYYYYQRNGSISHVEFSPKLVGDRFDLNLERLNFLKDYYPSVVDLQIAKMLGDAYISIIKLKGVPEVNEVRIKMIEFIKNNKDNERRLAKYSNRIMLHYYCYPLFLLYVKLFIK